MRCTSTRVKSGPVGYHPGAVQAPSRAKVGTFLNLPRPLRAPGSTPNFGKIMVPGSPWKPLLSPETWGGCLITGGWGYEIATVWMGTATALPEWNPAVPYSKKPCEKAKKRQHEIQGGSAPLELQDLLNSEARQTTSLSTLVGSELFQQSV